MNWSNVKLIVAREIRDQLRDRRTMFMIVVLPILLYPLLGMAFFQFAQFVEERPTRVLIVGAKGLPAEPPLVQEDHFSPAFFRSPEKAKLLEVEFATDELNPAAAAENLPAEARRAVQAGQYEAALYFPPDFGRRLETFRQTLRKGATGLEVPKPVFIYTTANEKSQLTHIRLMDVWQRWNDQFRRMNLAAVNLPESFIAPIEPETVDVAANTGFSGAAAWSKVLPVLLLIWALTGAFYPAVDLCAGEKERGTLETLLSSPAERSEIVMGKLLTIMLFSSLTALLNVVSMGMMGWLVLARLPGFGPPPLYGSIWLAFALLPASALFSALCLAIAAFARSTKEGQYYLMPLLLVTMPLAVLPATARMELTLGNSLIPVTGMVLLLRTALEGNYWQAVQFLPPVILVTSLCCVLAIRWAVDQFNAESVLFRESERLELRLWLRHLVQDRRDTPSAAEALFCGIMILLVRFFLSFHMPPVANFSSFAVMAVVTQMAAVVTPTLVMTFILTSSPRRTLLLRWPGALSVLAAAALAIFLHPAVHVLQAGVMRLYPVTEEVQKALKGMDTALSEGAGWQILIILAMLPAVCEELAFRGFLFTGFRRIGKWRAIAYSAFFFGLSHSLLQQSLIAGLVGVVIGFMAAQTGSILPGMVFHLLHNALGALGGRMVPELTERWPALANLVETSPDGAVTFHWPATVIGSLLAIMILVWLHRRPEPSQEGVVS